MNAFQTVFLLKYKRLRENIAKIFMKFGTLARR